MLVNPLIEISTKHIFENLNLSYNYNENFDFDKIDKLNFFKYLKKKRNDLEPTAEKICPKIKEINNFLKEKLMQNFQE